MQNIKKINNRKKIKNRNKITNINKIKDKKNIQKSIPSCRYALYRMSDVTSGMSGQDKLIRRLYGTSAGRSVLSVLVRPWVSRCAGVVMDSPLSRIFIRPFIKKNDIDMSQCVKRDFISYNDFFKRELLPGARRVDKADDAFVSPCDSRLTVYDIEDGKNSRFNIKDSEYDLGQLFRDKKLAQKYKGGKLWLFRLCVDDYHRYIYNVDGIQSDVRRINGVYHTVNPIAGEFYRIYKENSREYCLIKTKKAGTVAYMEVGALLVGRIENKNVNTCRVRKGQEKGNFAFGGSTIILVTQKDSVVPELDIIHNSSSNIETKVRQGQRVGTINI